MLHYRYYNCDLMDMNYVYGQCMYCIGLDPKYALICYVLCMICICLCRNYRLSMRLIPRKFFQVVVTFLQVHNDRFCIASTAGVRSPSSSARHDSLHLKGLRVYLRPVVYILYTID